MKMRSATLMSMVAAVVMIGGLVYAGVRDATIKVTRAMPPSTQAVTSTAIDTGKSTSLGKQHIDADFVLEAPAVTQAELPDGKTFTYAVAMSDNANLSSSSTLYPSVIVQTGSTGAAAAEFRFRIPTTAKRYIFFTVTPSDSGTGDASGKSATLDLDFN
jgi:hypothetical protein